MSKKCQVCSHPKRLEIDKMIVRGVSIAEISRKYGVSYDSLWSHAKNHLNYQLLTAVKQKMETNSFNLMNEIEDILNKAKTIFDRNFEKNTRAGDETALKALSEHRQTLNLLNEAVATYYQLKVMELEKERQKYEFKLSEDIKRGLKKLTLNELAVFELLIAKVHGEFKGNVFRTLGIKVEPGVLASKDVEGLPHDWFRYLDED